MNTLIRIFAGFVGILYCLLMPPVSAHAKISHGTQSDTSKECAICHFKWVEAFFTEHRGTPLAPLQTTTVVGDKEMCLSCHDGTVTDSRDKICNDPGHREGTIPSSKVRIPDTFPLSEEGALMCSTCHTPHALKDERKDLSHAFLRAPNNDSSFCRLCHTTQAGGISTGNHPVDVSTPEIPSRIISAGGVLGNGMKNQIICQTCHMAHGGINDKFLVLPVDDPDRMTVLCEACHRIDQAKTAAQKSGKYSHPVDIAPKGTAEVPERWSSGERVHLGTEGQVVCRTCHRTHGAKPGTKLLTTDNYADSICMQCHRSQALVLGTDHDLDITAPEFRNSLGQAASQGGVCSPCHIVHNALHGRFLWAMPLGPEIGGTKDMNRAQSAVVMERLCTTCHAQEGIAEHRVPEFTLHTARITLPRELNGIKNSNGQPLFPVYRAGEEPSFQGHITCSTCHDPHIWASGDRSDNSPGRNTEGNMTNSFLRANIAEKFCSVCHGEESIVKFMYFHSATSRVEKKMLSPYRVQTIKPD
jgi:predicted CXXCH cytochrome family protein